MHCIIIVASLILVDANDSDVIHTHAGHSDVDRPLPLPPAEKPAEIPSEKPQEKPLEKPQEEPYFPTEADVIFVPNEKAVVRNEDYYRSDSNLKLDKVEDATGSSKDTVFISGKNNENVEQPIKEEKEIHADVIRVGKEKHGDVRTKKTKLDCRNVICENNVGYICGRREDEGKTKFRLFLNECYLRKVNCGFKNENNRYTVVGMQHCMNVDIQTGAKKYMDTRNTHKYADASEEILRETRRSFMSRRSSSKGVDGQPCSHMCPVSCTEDYDPQCAMSSTGHRKVFVNHCKLDYHSCLHGTIWYRRPLSECVGVKKADMQQNKGFIGWMQRVGIVDKKGRINLQGGADPALASGGGSHAQGRIQ